MKYLYDKAFVKLLKKFFHGKVLGFHLCQFMPESYEHLMREEISSVQGASRVIKGRVDFNVPYFVARKTGDVCYYVITEGGKILHAAPVRYKQHIRSGETATMAFEVNLPGLED